MIRLKYLDIKNRSATPANMGEGALLSKSIIDKIYKIFNERSQCLNKIKLFVRVEYRPPPKSEEK